MVAEVPEAVVDVLTARFGPLSHVGSGAWSTAFKFVRGDDEFVVRVGAHLADFEQDAAMSELSSASLPIPIVSEVDQLDAPHDHLFICVSTFAPGQPLEECAPSEWIGLVPLVADLLGAMRAVPVPAGASAKPWPQTLLKASDGGGRLQGWQQRLARRPQQQETYDRVMTRLKELCELPHVAEVPRTLLHCDLINANVHVDGGAITGVFDWGCRRWGDHLYDLAWFVFWDPWMKNLDAELLQRDLIGRWGHAPDADRFAACLLHIGADHLVYNAATGDATGGHELIERLATLNLL